LPMNSTFRLKLMTQTKYKVQSKGTHASVFSRFRFSEHSSVSDKEQSRSIASLFGMNDDSNQSIAFTSMINLSRCVIVQAEGGKEERRRKKKERRERSVFFSLLAQISVFSFVYQSSPALARAMNSEAP